MQASDGVITGPPRIPRTAGGNKKGLGHWFGEDTAQCVVTTNTTTSTTTTTTTILVLQLCTQEDVASFIASLNVFPHAAENEYKLCKPYEGDPRCQKEQLCLDLSIHFGGCTDSKPLINSTMSLFKCLCTNLTSNKSVTMKISFHFTQAMLQLLYQS